MSTEDQPSVSAPNPIVAEAVLPVSAPDPIVTESPPEPPPPFWLKRQYIKRAFGFDWEGTYIEGSFFRLDSGHVDCDGLFGGRSFESTDDLIRLTGASGDRANALVAKIRKLLGA